MKFITPISMPCTEAQYNELKPLLEAIGYEDCTWQYDAYIGCIKPLAIASTVINLTTYNKDLFLALAAMTDEPNGIAGEWWVRTSASSSAFKNGRLYKAISPVDKAFAFVDDFNDPNGVVAQNKTHFTKASISEIFAHFGVSYGKEQAEPIQPEMPQPTPFQGIDRRTYLAGCISQGYLVRYGTLHDSDIRAIILSVDNLITELDKTK